MKLTTNEDFVELNEQLQLFLSKRNNLIQRDYILSLGFDDIIDNQDLTKMDIFQAFIAVMLMVHKVALDYQVYEICMLTREVVEKEKRFIERTIKLTSDEILKEHLELELHYSLDYFDVSLQNIVNDNCKKNY